MGTLPGFVEGFNNVARDEHRHVAFGARFLRDCAEESDEYREAIERTMQEVLPIADKVLVPPWAEDMPEDFELFGVSVADTRDFAIKALTRRLKVIGLVAPAS
jgi:ribonucleoside-diphosphate reductase beta chain